MIHTYSSFFDLAKKIIFVLYNGKIDQQERGRVRVVTDLVWLSAESLTHCFDLGSSSASNFCCMTTSVAYSSITLNLNT